jgi:hypothetical protein
MMTLTERIKDTELFYESMSRLLQHLFKSAVIRRSASINARMPSGCAKNAYLISYPSPSWMVHGMDLFQALARYMRIYLRGGNIHMAQQHLHDTQVGAVIEQVRSKGMA